MHTYWALLFCTRCNGYPSLSKVRSTLWALPKCSTECSVSYEFLQSCGWSRHPPGPMWMRALFPSNPSRWFLPWTWEASSQARWDWRPPEASVCAALFPDTLSYEYQLPSSPLAPLHVFSSGSPPDSTSVLGPPASLKAVNGGSFRTFLICFHRSGFLSFIAWCSVYWKP